MKKNYLSKNRDEIDSLYKDLKVAYNEAYKKYGQKNLVGILIHELCHFCFTSVCIKNIKSKNKFLLTNPIFLSRKNHKVFDSKFYYKHKFVNGLLNFLPFKKKLRILKDVPFDKKEKLKLILISILNGYTPSLGCDKKFHISDIDIQMKILLKHCKKISKKYNIKFTKNNFYRNLNIFIKNFFSNKIIEHDYQNLYLTGTPADIFNKLTINNAKKNDKVILISHSKESGLCPTPSWQYNDYSFCTDLIGWSKKGHPKNKIKFYKPLSNCKINYYPTNNLKGPWSSFVNKISYDQFKNGEKIVYLSGKITNISCIGVRTYNPQDYIDWQKQILNNFKNVKVKYHPKQTLILKKFKNNEVVNKSIQQLIDEKYTFIIDVYDSSTVMEISLSNRPIIFFDLGYWKIEKNILKNIKERMLYYKVNFPGNNHISFNKFKKIFNQKKINYFGPKYFFDPIADSSFDTTIKLLRSN